MIGNGLIFDLVFILEFHNEFNESSIRSPLFKNPVRKQAEMNLDVPQSAAKIWTLIGFSLENHPLGITLWECGAGTKTPLKWRENSSRSRQRGPK
jgi:hypothetical protein